MIDLGTCPHCGWLLSMAEPVSHAPDDKALPEPAKSIKADRLAKQRQYARDYAAKRRAAKASKSR